MSLQTDIIFVKALSANTELISQLAAKGIYNTSIPLPDAEYLNAPIPYIIVRFDGLQNDGSNKDETYEGESDTVNISIEIVAEKREKLAELAKTVRTTVREFFEQADPSDDDYDLVPVDYQFSASPISYDADKPCFWQVLNYECDTNA